MGADVDRFHCPACGKKYAWRVEVAGKKVKCTCGARIRCPEDPWADAQLLAASDTPFIPDAADAAPPPRSAPSHPPPLPSAAAPSPPPDDDYQLNLAEPAPGAAPAAAPGQCPGCGGTVSPAAIICIHCGYNIKEGVPVATRVDDPIASAGIYSNVRANLQARADAEAEQDAAHRRSELYVPLILLGVGLLIILINNFVIVPKVERIREENAKEQAAKWAAKFGGPPPAINTGGVGGGNPLLSMGMQDDDDADYDDWAADDDDTYKVSQLSVAENRENFASQTDFDFSQPAAGSSPAAAPPTAAATTAAAAPAASASTAGSLKSSFIGLLVNSLELIFQIPFLLLGMLVTVRLFGATFGPLLTALLKMVALALLVIAVSGLVDGAFLIITDGLMGGLYVRYSLVVGMFYAVCYYFWQLEVMESFVLYVTAYFLPPIAITMGVMWLIFMLFG